MSITAVLYKKPLLTTLFLAATSIALFPEKIPKKLFYEVGVIDLIFRAKLSRIVSHFSWFHQITPYLYLGGIPLSHYRHQKILKVLGIRSVLAVVEDWEGFCKTPFGYPVSKREWKKEGISYRRISCKDLHAISLKTLKRSIFWMHMQVLRGKKVYVHCKSGWGRSAMIVSAYLMRYQRMNLHEALSYVVEKRPVVHLRRCQMALLKEWENHINSK